MNKKLNRRTLLKLGLAATAGHGHFLPWRLEASQAQEEEAAPSPEHVGVLVDTTLCIGCRKCEEACNRRNHLPRTAESFSDRDVLRSFRRPTETAFTVVNQFPGSPSPDQAGVPQTYAKVQCMHCLYPSCVSACIVGALTKVGRRRRGLQSHHLHRVPVLPGRLSLRDPGLRVPRTAHAAGAQVRVLHRPCQGHRGQSCLRRLLSHGGAGLRPPGGIARHGQGPPEAAPGPLHQPCLRRKGGGRDVLALPDRHGRCRRSACWICRSSPAAQRTEAIQHGIFRYGMIPIAFYGLLSYLCGTATCERPDECSGHGRRHRRAFGSTDPREVHNEPCQFTTIIRIGSQNPSSPSAP